MMCLALRAAEPDAATADKQFNEAYAALTKADEARDRDDPEDALLLYREALTRYTALARKYPQWQSGVVAFRLAYCSDQIKALASKLKPAPHSAASGGDIILIQTNRFRPPTVDLPTAGNEGPDAILVAARRMLSEGEAAKARTILLQGLRHDPDSVSTRLLMGIAQCMTENFGDAVFLLQQLLAENPDNAHAHMVLGTAYFGLGRLPDAAGEMEKALAISPDLKEAHYNMSQILASSTPPDLDRARTHYTRSVELGGERDSHLELLLEP